MTHANLPSTQLRHRNDFPYFFGAPEICFHCTTKTVLNQVVSCPEEGDWGQFSPAFRQKFLQLYGGLLNLPTTLPQSSVGNYFNCVVLELSLPRLQNFGDPSIRESGLGVGRATLQDSRFNWRQWSIVRIRTLQPFSKPLEWNTVNLRISAWALISN